MLRDLRVKIGVLALTLTSAAVIVAHAQIVAPSGPTLPPGFCTGGPFTVNGGEVKFHVALDDHPRAPSMRVSLRLYDSAGAIVARRTVTLAAGAAATLEFRGGGLLRAQATFDSLVNPSDRRETVGTVELHDVDNFRAVIPVQCVPNENIGR
jgi:hypothetical protein